MNQITMSRIVSIQMIGKKTGNPYRFEDLEKLSYEELSRLQEMELARYNELVK